MRGNESVERMTDWLVGNISRGSDRLKIMSKWKGVKIDTQNFNSKKREI